MRDSFVFKTERPWPNKRLKIAAIVGHTTPTSTKIWLRTGAPGNFTLLWYPRPKTRKDRIFAGFQSVPYPLAALPAGIETRAINVADWGNDSTAVEALDGLDSGAEYGYALHSEAENRIVLGQDRPFSFRTFPGGDDSGTVPFSFGFFSCHMPYHETLFGNTILDNMDMWDLFQKALLRHRDKGLLFNIAGGDQVYSDGVPTLSVWKYLNKVMRVEGGKLLPSQDEMVSWYRDIYRGYWGFKTLQTIYSSFPTYMIWDDHELGDGWGSYFRKKEKIAAMEPLLPSLIEKKIGVRHASELFDRMFAAARQVYTEYQHSHNPDTVPGIFDYGFYVGDCAFYMLDGRGNRDVERRSHRVLGAEQLQRFAAWLELKETRSKSFLFVVSAIPVLHLRPSLVNADKSFWAKFANLADDLRDSWEHNLHDKERKELTQLLFRAAGRGQGVSILSGDVHIAAVFQLSDSEGRIIYQLTSSAITYNVPRPLQILVGLGVPDDGTTKDGYDFKRMALFTQSNFSIIKVNQKEKEVVFQLYGPQSLPEIRKIGAGETPVPHSMVKIPLRFS